MLYPIISYEDGTEVTASKPDSNGRITLYTEKFDKEADEFIYAEILIPNPTVVSSRGYDREALDEMLRDYAEIQDDVMEYVMDKVNR